MMLPELDMQQKSCLGYYLKRKKGNMRIPSQVHELLTN